MIKNAKLYAKDSRFTYLSAGFCPEHLPLMQEAYADSKFVVEVTDIEEKRCIACILGVA